MARITLFPKDGNGVVNGELAEGVDFSGIDPTISCVQWYDTIGSVEYVSDPISGYKPENTTIDSIAPYQVYVDNSVTIIDAFLNPVIVYSTASDVSFQGVTYGFASEIVISTPNTPPPPQSTPTVPPTPEDFQTLYWYNDGWVLSGFDPSLTLANAKTQLIQQVETSGAEQADDQARIYSSYQLVSSADAGALATADYFGLTLSDYQGYIDGQISTMTAEINAATTTSQLYSFDWRVEGNPNN